MIRTIFSQRCIPQICTPERGHFPVWTSAIIPTQSRYSEAPTAADPSSFGLPPARGRMNQRSSLASMAEFFNNRQHCGHSWPSEPPVQSCSSCRPMPRPQPDRAGFCQAQACFSPQECANATRLARSVVPHRLIFNQLIFPVMLFTMLPISIAGGLCGATMGMLSAAPGLAAHDVSRLLGAVWFLSRPLGDLDLKW